MLSAIGLIIAIALLIVMIVKGVDMITASVVTAAIILVTSGLDFWEGLLKTFSEGAGSFCSSWFLILALGGIFGELVNQTGLATKVAKSLSAEYVSHCCVLTAILWYLFFIRSQTACFVKIRWTAGCFRF